jgi:hypothetical protein
MQESGVFASTVSDCRLMAEVSFMFDIIKHCSC